MCRARRPPFPMARSRSFLGGRLGPGDVGVQGPTGTIPLEPCVRRGHRGSRPTFRTAVPAPLAGTSIGPGTSRGAILAPKACSTLRGSRHEGEVCMADMKTWGMYIGGEWVGSGRGETEPNINPSNGETADIVQIGTREDADRAVEAAQKAFDDVWFDTPPKERSAMMFALADAMDKDTDTLTKLEAEDVGKPISVSGADVPFIIDNLRFFAGAARHLEGKSSAEYEKGFTSIIRREPLGVTAGICPWNYPLMMAIWKVGPALAAGNTSVIKPAEITPRTSLRLAELSQGILPPGVLNVVTGHGSEIGDQLVKHDKVRLVSVTGDTATGKIIAANAAASNVKRAHLELGGKAPVVVFDDADLDKVVETLKFAGYTNTGQDCTASSRVVGVDEGRRSRDARGAAAAVRRGVGEHPLHDHGRDAARRVQGERVREGHVDVLARGLHADQARDVVARLSERGRQPGVARPERRARVTFVERVVIVPWQSDRST